LTRVAEGPFLSAEKARPHKYQRRNRSVATGLKDVGKSTPVVEVIRRVLESKGKPVTVEELTVAVMDSWGRDFPSSPFEDVGLVYKLATRVLNCETSYDEIDGQVPVVELPEEGLEPVPLHCRMGFEDLNRIVDEVRHVKVALPAPSLGRAVIEEKPVASGRKKK